jgi:hypothetical protein
MIPIEALMARIVLRVLVVAVCASGCVKEISSDERLERGTKGLSERQTVLAADLKDLRCDDVAGQLASARNESGPETERVKKYVELYELLKVRRDTFEDALSRNPDLAYQQGSEDRIAARDVCVRQVADVRLEFERYVRELVALPVVKEIKGGATVTIVRLDFPTLKQAIDVLALDDRDLLVSKLDRAEKKLRLR